MGGQRNLSGVPLFLARSTLIAISFVALFDVMGVLDHFGIVYHRSQALALLFGLVAVYTFLSMSLTESRAGETNVPWYDWFLVVMAICVNGYVVIVFGEMTTMMELATPERITLGAIGLFLALELVRRAVGWLLVFLAGAFILYAKYADFLPGALYARASSWERIATYLYFDPSGLYGVSLDVIAGVVFSFILFGNLLFATGGGNFIMDFALRLVGGVRGGPAKMAVVSSAMFGTMTGSAAANSVFTGMVTIPLMKRAGYKPAFAAAVEAVASSGGLIMPPVMGAAAFIMADFLNISYSDVALAAAIPAVIFFAAVFAQVHFVAKRDNLQPVPVGAPPEFRTLMTGIVMFFVPLVVLIYWLFVRGLTPERAVIYASGIILLLAVFTHRQTLHPKELLSLMEKTGKEMIQMMIIAGLAGLILGVVTLKGLGSSMSQILLSATGDSLFMLLLLTAVASIILGMGLPAVAIYILLAVLVAPAMVSFGVDPLAAHMFIFYFGIMSYVTPPMAFACFVTAPLAGADPFKTGIEGCKLSLVAYIVPFLFVYYPALLLQGTTVEIITAVANTTIAAILIAGGIAGYFIRKITMLERALLFLAAAGMMVRDSYLEIGGVVLLVILIAWLYTTRDRQIGRLETSPERS